MYSFFLLHFTYFWRIKHRECAFTEGLFCVGRGTWMFVRCIMKQHACIKFLSHLLSINYFMFVSFDILVVTPLTMAASVCTCLWRDVHYHGTQPIRERTCCVMGALFILFSVNVCVWYFKSSVSWAWKVTNHRSFVFSSMLIPYSSFSSAYLPKCDRFLS